MISIKARPSNVEYKISRTKTRQVFNQYLLF